MRWGRDGTGYKGKTHFWNAIQKYGWNNFKHEILFDNLTKNEAALKEQELIAFYNSNNPKYGYNMSSGGEYGGAGVKQSQETINKRILKLKGKKRTQEQKEAMSRRCKELYTNPQNHPKYGTHWSEEDKAKLSISAKNRPPISEETRNKLRLSHLGKRQSQETIDKRVSKVRGQKRTEEQRKRLSDALKLIPRPPMTEETKRKISESEKGKIIPEQTKEKMRASAHKRPVLQFNREGILIGTYDSIQNAYRQTGILPANIGKCLRGERKSAGGYEWRDKNT